MVSAPAGPPLAVMPLTFQRIPVQAPAPAPAPQPVASLIDDASFRHVTHTLRGVHSARVRFYGTDRAYEDEFIALLLAMEISVESEQITRIAPAPRQRFSFQFSARHATITVAAGLPLRA